MSRQKFVLAFIVTFAVLSAVIGYTASANYAGGNDNKARKPGRAPLKAVAAKSKSKKTRDKDENKKGKVDAGEDQDKEEKIIQINPNASTTPSEAFSTAAAAFGITPPIRSLRAVREGTKPVKGTVKILDKENNEARVVRAVPGAGAGDSFFEDPLALTSRRAKDNFQPEAMPAPSLTFDGILNNTLSAITMPPDTNGDVGPNHYVQTTNYGVFRIFNKTGAPLTAAAGISTLFSGLPAGNPCRTDDDGDPIVNYDPMADRWLISQFQVHAVPNGQCIAVSQTGDPTGAWYAYYFQAPNGDFPDYPKWGVWTDGYYMSVHEFNQAGTAYLRGGFFAFNREKMLAGDPTANYVYFSVASAYGQIPADIDGYAPPAPGTPQMFFMVDADEYGGTSTDSLIGYEFVPNFTTPANSTFTPKPALPVAAFDPRQPNSVNSIEQPSPATSSQYLDSIGGQLMFRVAYRNLGTAAVPVDSYVMNWTVNVSGANPTAANVYQAAIRWSELRRNSVGILSLFDQGTHAPDAASGTGRNRWMGSIAQDNQGNIALGFTRSGLAAGQNPDIVWAGRTGGQTPAGVMNEGETTMFASTGVQQATNGRWGDYSAMTVDPTDDCTFWYTTLYRNLANNGTSGNNPFLWSTRIGKFKFPTCTAQPKGQISANVTYCGTNTPVSNAKVVATAGNFFRLTNGAGNLVSNIIAAPGVYTVTASKGNFAPVSMLANVTDGGTTPINLCLAGSLINSTAAAIASESCAANNAADPGELVTVNLGLQNLEGSNTSNLTATLLPTGGVTNPGAPQNYGALASGGVAATRSFTFTVDPNVAPGSTVTLTLALADGALNLGTVTYTLPVGATTGSPQTFNYTGAATAIPDNNPTGVNTTVIVSGVAGGIQDLNFVVTGTAATPAASTGIDHPWIGDLTVKLTSPLGTTVTLISRPGGSSCSADNIFNLTLDDAAPNSIACPSPGPLTGTFKPQNPLSAFNGQNPNGTWTLNVSDNAGGDIGSVRAYRLVITSGSAACIGRAVGGTVKYGIDLTKSVPNVTMGAAGASSYSTTTNASGVYSLPGLIGGNSYTLTPTKTGDRNGITSFDATLVLRCIAAGGGCALTAEQQIAADANGSGNLTSFDATLILRYVAAGAPTANTGQVGTWKFSPPQRNYLPLNASLSGEDYKGFLVGEVNGNWTPVP